MQIFLAYDFYIYVIRIKNIDLEISGCTNRVNHKVSLNTSFIFMQEDIYIYFFQYNMLENVIHEDYFMFNLIYEIGSVSIILIEQTGSVDLSISGAAFFARTNLPTSSRN